MKNLIFYSVFSLVSLTLTSCFYNDEQVLESTSSADSTYEYGSFFVDDQEVKINSAKYYPSSTPDSIEVSKVDSFSIGNFNKKTLDGINISFKTVYPKAETISEKEFPAQNDTITRYFDDGLYVISSSTGNNSTQIESGTIKITKSSTNSIKFLIDVILSSGKKITADFERKFEIVTE